MSKSDIPEPPSVDLSSSDEDEEDEYEYGILSALEKQKAKEEDKAKAREAKAKTKEAKSKTKKEAKAKTKKEAKAKAQEEEILVIPDSGRNEKIEEIVEDNYPDDDVPIENLIPSSSSTLAPFSGFSSLAPVSARVRKNFIFFQIIFQKILKIS